MSAHDHVHAIKLGVIEIPEEEKKEHQSRFDAPFPKTVFFELENRHVEVRHKNKFSSIMYYLLFMNQVMHADTGMVALVWLWEDVLDFSK